MEELQLISRQHPGEVVIDNFLEMKDALAQVLARYENVVYTEDMLSDAKADKKELTRLRKEIDDRRKEVKKAYLAPYNEFEAQVKELLAMVDAPLDESRNLSLRWISGRRMPSVRKSGRITADRPLHWGSWPRRC